MQDLVQTDGSRLSPIELISRLAPGWTSRAGLMEELIRCWRKAIEGTTEIIEIADDAAYFTCSVNHVRLRGFSELHCLLIGGSCERLEWLQNWKLRLVSPGRQIVVLALSIDAFLRSEPLFSARTGLLLLRPKEIETILTSPPEVDCFTMLARKYLSPRRLNPFGILSSPDANMFVGRQNELDILYQSENTSYAIAGPGRIGKTSLIQHFRRRLRTDDPARYSRSVMVDFMNCHSVVPEAICQFLAIHINDGRRARELKPSQLDSFLHFAQKARQGRIELLLDEVDRVCESETFMYLAEAAKNKLCRLVLCGKEVLYENMHNPKSIVYERLRLLRLPALAEEEAQVLLLEPLCDLGFTISDPKRLTEEILKDTGRFPHLIQFYGGALVDLATSRRTDQITLELLEAIRDDFETSQVFAGPVLNLQDEVTEWVALALLHQQQTSFSEADIRHVIRREGMPLDEKEVSRICRKLYINNILVWDRENYHIANRALSRCTRKLGYFTPRLAELRKTGVRSTKAKRTSA